MFKFTNSIKKITTLKKSLWTLFFVLGFSQVFSQNVGIGTTTPTNTLHIANSPSSLDPLRIEGLNLSNTISSILVVDTTTGIIRRIPFDTLVTLVGDSVNTDNQLLTLSNDTLYIEDGNWVVITHPNDTSLIDSLILSKADTLFQLMRDSIYKFVSDSLLNDTLWINKLDSLLLNRKDTLYFNDTTYSVVRDSLLRDTLFLDSLRGLFTDSVNDADSVIGNEYNTNFTLVGNVLTITDGGGPRSINLSGLGVGSGILTRVALTGGSSYQITPADGDIIYTSGTIETDTLFLPDAATNIYHEIKISRQGTFGSVNRRIILKTKNGENIISACASTHIDQIILHYQVSSFSCFYRSVLVKSDGTDWVIMNSNFSN